MDKRLSKLIKDLGLNLSVETVQVLEEYLHSRPTLSYEQFKKNVDWILQTTENKN